MEHQENIGSTAGVCNLQKLRDLLVAHNQETQSECLEITRVIREEPREELSEADLEKIVDITLVETETIWLIDIPGIVVSSEDSLALEIAEKNSKYNTVRFELLKPL